MRLQPETGSPDDIGEISRSSPDLRDLLEARCEIGIDFWQTNAAVDTGYLRSAIETLITNDGPGGAMQGVVYAKAEYAMYREMGTRYITPDRILVQCIGLIEAG